MKKRTQKGKKRGLLGWGKKPNRLTIGGIIGAVIANIVGDWIDKKIEERRKKSKEKTYEE